MMMTAASIIAVALPAVMYAATFFGARRIIRRDDANTRHDGIDSV